MRNHFLYVIFCLLFITIDAQESSKASDNFSFQEISFSPSSPDLEFSGLSLFKEKLFLLPENKKSEGVYVLNAAQLYNQKPGAKNNVKAKLYKFTGLSVLINKINKRGQGYDGLEALVATEKDLYFSVETIADTCYLIKGRMAGNTIDLDPNFLLALLKPKLANGNRTCNAGFEGMQFWGSELFCFFEFNDLYDAKVLAINTTSWEITEKPIAKLPFRLTDVTWNESNKIIGINYFYSGGGCDTIYQPEKNSADYHLVWTGDTFSNLARLIELEQTKDGLNWRPVFDFPEPYKFYNWEGIAAYGKSYFLINDRYTGGKQGSHLYLLKLKE